MTQRTHTAGEIVTSKVSKAMQIFRRPRCPHFNFHATKGKIKLCQIDFLFYFFFKLPHPLCQVAEQRVSGERRDRARY